MLTDAELAAIDRNRLRLRTFADRGQTLDMFAHQDEPEALTLLGEAQHTATTTTTRTTPSPQLAFSL